MNNPLNPMEQQGPDPMGGNSPLNQPNPANPGPIYDEKVNYTRIYQIGLGVLGFLLLVSLIFVIVYYKKAGRSEQYWSGVISEREQVKEKEVRGACDLEKKDLQEKPWASFKARDEFGAFTFTIPRSWSKYEIFDVNDNNPYQLYFSQDVVRYDSNTNIKAVHAPFEVIVSKKLYDAEIVALQNDIKRNKDNQKTEEKVNISNFEGTKFTYIDKDLGRRIGVILIPYRDRALYIKTDDYDKWNGEYYDKFWKSFALTP